MSERALKQLDQAAREVREYGVSDNNRAWLGLFVALTECLKNDLLHAEPVHVPALQAQARQLEALRVLVMSETFTSGRA